MALSAGHNIFFTERAWAGEEKEYKKGDFFQRHSGLLFGARANRQERRKQ
jgi:hypothetical protein